VVGWLLRNRFSALFFPASPFWPRPEKFRRSVRTWPAYRRARTEFRRQDRASGIIFAEGRDMPFLLDRRQAGGNAKSQLLSPGHLGRVRYVGDSGHLRDVDLEAPDCRR
jgi:hypothetical protein